MAKETINNGTFTDDTSAEAIRISFDKVNSNFTELYANLGLGGSLKVIEQPISLTGASSGDSETKQVADAINARTNIFTIPLGSLPIVSTFLPYNAGDTTTNYLHKNLYILNTGNGTYGVGGTITLDASNVTKFDELDVLPDTIIDLGDIGVTAISTAMNNANPSNTKLGITKVTAIQSTVQENYIFDAANGDYGSLDLQTSSDNFIDLNAEPILNKALSDGAKEPYSRAVDVTIALEDLGRTNVFTQSNSAITVDNDAGLFIENGTSFLIFFTGSGTHTITAPFLAAATPSTYKQRDLVFIQKISTNNWVVNLLGEQQIVSTALSIESISATQTMDLAFDLTLITANTFTLNLPTAVGVDGEGGYIQNSGTGIVTIDGNTTETINGSLTQTVNQWESIQIVSNGANWIIIG